MKHATLIFAFSLLFAYCKQKSESDKILEEFKKVNESITESNKDLEEKSYKELYRIIQSKQATNPELAKAADSLYQAVDTAYQYLEKLRLTLRAANEDDLRITTRLIEKSANSDTLASLLLKVSDNVKLCPISTDKKVVLDENLSTIEFIRNDSSWKKTYFEKTPAIAALTILAKFQNDVRNIASLAMHDMARQLK